MVWRVIVSIAFFLTSISSTGSPEPSVLTPWKQLLLPSGMECIIRATYWCNWLPKPCSRTLVYVCVRWMTVTLIFSHPSVCLFLPCRYLLASRWINLWKTCLGWRFYCLFHSVILVIFGTFRHGWKYISDTNFFGQTHTCGLVMLPVSLWHPHWFDTRTGSFHREGVIGSSFCCIFPKSQPCKMLIIDYWSYSLECCLYTW